MFPVIFTSTVAQYVSDAKHLCAEDTDCDEQLRYDAQGSPQVLGSEFSQVHGHHVGRQTCRQRKQLLKATPSTVNSGYFSRPAQMPTINLATMMIS